MDSPRLVAGRYELIDSAGDGGMARVYRAALRGAAGFQRTVAVKRVHDHLAGNTEFVRMFIEEARVCSELDHANIVQVHDFGVDAGGYYLVMEWIDGLHLGQYVASFQQRSLRTPWRLVASICAQVLAGLAAAHERTKEDGTPSAVVHRDVTPHNILLSVQGVTKLSDFGLARAMDRARMTNPDVVKGKLSYLAPELVQGHPASPGSDIYSLGIVLWEALTAERLYAADSDAERIRKVRDGEVPFIGERRDDLPDGLVAIVHGALQRELDKRFTSAHEMEHALLRLMGGDPVSARELGQSVVEARVAVGLSPRSLRPAPVSAAASEDVVLVLPRAVVVKSDV
jgi:serine/threonine-protein kinase